MLRAYVSSSAHVFGVRPGVISFAVWVQPKKSNGTAQLGGQRQQETRESRNVAQLAAYKCG